MLRQARFDRTTQELDDVKAKLEAAQAEVERLQLEFDALTGPEGIESQTDQ